MLERLAVSSHTNMPEAADLEGTVWTPLQTMDGFGTLSDASTLPGVPGPALVENPTGPDLRPGLYRNGDQRLARNVLTTESELIPATWPADVPVEGLSVQEEQPLGGALLSLAILLLAADIVASLALS